MGVQLSVFPQSRGKDNCREVPSVLGGFIFAAKVELDSNPAKVFDFLVEHRAREPVRSDSVAQKAPWRIFFLEYRDLISQADKVGCCNSPAGPEPTTAKPYRAGPWQV